MPADPARLRFFVDESVLGLGKALAIARDDVIHTGHPLIPGIPTGTLDHVWIPDIAARGLVVIARDRRLKSKPIELELFRQHGLRVFAIAGKKNLKNWDYLVRIVRRWDDIERTLADRGPGPWFMNINEANIKEITLRQ